MFNNCKIANDIKEVIIDKMWMFDLSKEEEDHMVKLIKEELDKHFTIKGFYSSFINKDKK